MHANIYTDGSCLRNPGGPGGWGVVCIMQDGAREERSGPASSTTNNRMELAAAIEGLDTMTSWERDHGSDGAPRSFTLCTDSKYVLQGITSWIRGWRRNGWKTSQGKDVVNRDLWQALAARVQAAQGKNITFNWHWVKGHDGNDGNERADELAGTAARTQRGMSRFVSAPQAEQEAAAGRSSADETAQPTRASDVIELNTQMTDEELGSMVRAALQAAGGDSIRLVRENIRNQNERQRVRG